MAVWVDNDTRLLVQGITGKEGTFHALGCRDYGTKVMAGVTPGKGGRASRGSRSTTRSPRPARPPAPTRR